MMISLHSRMKMPLLQSQRAESLHLHCSRKWPASWTLETILCVCVYKMEHDLHIKPSMHGYKLQPLILQLCTANIVWFKLTSVYIPHTSCHIPYMHCRNVYIQTQANDYMKGNPDHRCRKHFECEGQDIVCVRKILSHAH